MQLAKAFYENKLIESLQTGASRVIYSYIRSISEENSLPLTIYIHGSSTDSDRDTAHLFNQYFYSSLQAALIPYLQLMNYLTLTQLLALSP